MAEVNNALIVYNYFGYAKKDFDHIFSIEKLKSLIKQIFPINTFHKSPINSNFNYPIKKFLLTNN